ncbi:asparaginase [Denitromonas sp. IR12]|uniref:asparaginase n=1 Tax=Denitromonas iodatirespirans TaxID=2795389 RepID=A0A944H8J7_DENI1|nr:asparaginase [Denitromonas iodatirespirans]
MNARVLILHTGGTIGMTGSPDGLRPMAGFGAALGAQLRATGAPDCDIVELAPLIDSANLQPAHWRHIAEALLSRWADYAGFVVLHGTDTMAWSASALSFMLRGADKPVIFTGAQIPLLQPRSDAAGNLRAALEIAAGGAVREVGLLFGQRLLRGNRSRKLKSVAFDAFDSPNCLPLADIGIDITVHRERLLAPAERRFTLPAFDAEAVAVLPVWPGLPARVVDALLESPAVRGLILASYGVGNVPDADAALIDTLARAVDRGVVVLNTSQCPTGPVAQGAYATGAVLNRIGVVPGGDMTPEAAFAKLHVLLAEGGDAAAVRAQIGRPLCGEMS